MTADKVANILTALALLGSMIAIYIQTRIYSQEWRPILTYKSVKIQPIINDNLKTGRIEIDLNFENSGKCTLRYEIKSLHIFFNGIKQPDVVETSKGSVVGVGQSVSFNRFYQIPFDYKENTDLTPLVPKNVKIIFNLEYKKITKRSKKYFMGYEIEATHSEIGYRALFGSTYET